MKQIEIDKLIKEAILEKNGAKKEAYRAIKSELLLITTGKNAPSTIDEATKVKVIRKLISQREESIAMYDANSRKELADMYREQNKYLKELLPPEISKEQIQESVYGLYPNGFTKKEMGKVIKALKDIYPTADGKVIAETVKENIHE
jgi:uncharacterized protein YqeY